MNYKNEDELKILVAKNLATYRKLNNLTQLELAERLNYSDKAISKWESGASLPDLYTLTQIANIYGISVNDLVKERRLLQGFIVRKRRTFLALFSVGIVYFIACLFYAIFILFLPINRPWLSFIYGVPISCITLLVLYSVWKRRWIQFALLSLLVWSIAVCLDLSMPLTTNWLYYILAIPLQTIILTIFLSNKAKR